MSLETSKKKLWLPPSTSRETFRQWQCSAWTCFSRLKPVVSNPQATDKREDYFDAAGATGSNRTPFAEPHLKLCSFMTKKATLLPWIEFKAFLQKSQGDSRGFVYITWSCIRQDFQYQQEKVLHWASHLEHS